jgi:glycosyltransferase involved in cell wall biosynthesis
MNIVLVNHYAGGQKFGMEFRPYYLAKEWKQKGHNVVIVAASFAHLRSTQPTVNKSIGKETVDGVDYIWIKTNSYKGNGIMRILSMLSFTKSLYFNLEKELEGFRPDLFIASSTYPFDIIPLYKLAKKYKSKLCFEVHDLWPLSPIEFGGFSKYHPFIMGVQWAEDYAYKKADLVVSLLPVAKSYMVSRGMRPEKFVHIPNGIASEEWNEQIQIPNDHQQLLSALKTEGKFLVGYAGSHGIANALNALVASARLLEENIAIVLIGNGPEKQNLLKIVSEKKIKNVYFLASIPKDCIPAALKYFDALYVAFQKQSLLRFGISPNKMFDYMMAERPIIQAIEAGNNIVEEYQCGIAVIPEDPEEIAKGIEKLSKMTKDERVKLGRNGKEAVLKFHDYKVLAQQFIESVNNVQKN